jgi:hypothetical protein
MPNSRTSNLEKAHVPSLQTQLFYLWNQGLSVQEIASTMQVSLKYIGYTLEEWGKSYNLTRPITSAVLDECKKSTIFISHRVTDYE